MDQISAGGPAFGRANLDNCEREQIHLPGSIQPHGALLVLRPARNHADGLRIIRASENAVEFLKMPPGTALVGAPLTTISEDFAALVTDLANASKPADSPATGSGADEAFPATLTLSTTRQATNPALAAESNSAEHNEQRDANLSTINNRDSTFDCVVQRTSEGLLILEFEYTHILPESVSAELHEHIERISNTASLQSLCDIATDIFKRLFGYDRVMVYRFASDGHGEVFAESCEPDMDPYLGNHYPASDIPQIARELYKTNRVRLLPDVSYKPVTLRPKPGVGEPELLDMSACHLRSMSPMHLEYLRNMGVEATLVTSLTVGDRLWGLITCNHSSPKNMGYESRTVAELLAEIVATRISALDSLVMTRIELSVQSIEKKMIEAVSQEGEWAGALFDRSGTVLQPLDATGAALTTVEGIHTVGEVPSNAELYRLASWLSKANSGTLFQSQCLGLQHPELASIAEICPGVIAAPISRVEGEYLFWFRPEHIHSIIWGGDPRNPKVLREQLGAPVELTPRKSFEKWTEELRDTSRAWSDAELSAARLLSASVADVIQQFRAMRVMIAHDQLESLTVQITESDLPALIADADGKVLLTNYGFDNLMWQNSMRLSHISDLPRLFQEPAFARHNVNNLLQDREPWRGSATLDSKAVLVRGDPVFSAPDKILGYVILLTDISDRQLAENAKRRFPNQGFRNADHGAANMDAATRHLYDDLFSAVLENAQIAAMEITDGIDAKRIPNMLESVEASVSRTSRLISHLLQHSKPAKR